MKQLVKIVGILKFLRWKTRVQIFRKELLFNVGKYILTWNYITYISYMENFLSGKRKFEKVSLKK